MWFKMKAWDVASAQRGKYQINLVETLNCNVATAFNAFRAGKINQWFSDINSTKWLSEQQEVVGGLRQVNLKTMSVKERFINWEENKRFTFYMEAASLPLFDAMIEDCQFEDLGNGTCRFKWDIYFEPNFVTGLIAPITKLIFNKMFSDGMKSLSNYVVK
jgi:hypothetical protein